MEGEAHCRGEIERTRRWQGKVSLVSLQRSCKKIFEKVWMLGSQKLKNERPQLSITNPMGLFVYERPMGDSWYKACVLRNLLLILYIWWSLLQPSDNSLTGYCECKDVQSVLSTGSPKLPADGESTGSVSDSLFSFSPSSCIQQVLPLFSFVAETA